MPSRDGPSGNGRGLFPRGPTSIMWGRLCRDGQSRPILRPHDHLLRDGVPRICRPCGALGRWSRITGAPTARHLEFRSSCQVMGNPQRDTSSDSDHTVPEPDFRVRGVVRGPRVTFYFNGKRYHAYENETVAAALYASGERVLRNTTESGQPRGLFCGMGVCFDCTVRINATHSALACQTPVIDGMRVESRQATGNGVCEA